MMQVVRQHQQQKQRGGKIKTVSYTHLDVYKRQALNRAAKDIWQNGRRRELRAYWIEEPPTAKELISLISAKLWGDRQG